MSPTPDLKKPKSFFSGGNLFLLFCVVVFVGIIGSSYYLKQGTKKNKPAQETKLVKQARLPADYFPAEKSVVEHKKEEKKNKNIIYREVKPKPLPKNKNFSEDRSRLVKSEIKTLTPDQIFNFEEPKEKINDEREKMLQKKLMSMRVSSSSGISGTGKKSKKHAGIGYSKSVIETSVPVEDEKEYEIKYIKEQKDWTPPEQKIIASYPTNLERVFTVDRVIPALLYRQLDSEIGGEVTAQVEENVYSAHGRNVLISAGSKCIGSYKPVGQVGSERIAIAWHRIITPEGININIGNGEMQDAVGQTGITGNVNRRYTEKYGLSLLVSLVTAATTYAIPVENANQQVTVEAVGSESSSIAKTILDDHLQMKPIITVPAGARIYITARTDVWFKEPKQKIVEVVKMPKGDINES